MAITYIPEPKSSERTDRFLEARALEDGRTNYPCPECGEEDLVYWLQMLGTDGARTCSLFYECQRCKQRVIVSTPTNR